MATGSGISGVVGGAKETTYGTRAVPTKFFEFRAEGGVRNQKYLESRQIRSGRFTQSASRRILTTRDVAFSVDGEVPNKGFGFFLDHLVAPTITPVQQLATTAYLATFNVGASDPGKSATFQSGKPSTDGTVRPFDFLGCMLSQAQFACAVDEWLTFNFGYDGQDEKTDQTLATASYPTSLEGFHFQQAIVTVNSIVQDGTTGVIPKSINLDLSMPRNTERYGLRSNALKAKPILNDYSPMSGSLTFEFTDLTQYALFTAGTKVPIIIDFVSASLAGAGYPFRLTFTIASAQFTGSTPTVSGNDILMLEAPFQILDDGTNPPVVITHYSTDSVAW